jgi:uncharacterized protein YgbK (DUF1537 family)
LSRDRPVIIHSGGEPAEIERAHAAFGPLRAARIVEGALGTIAAGLVAAGVRQLIVAGGETSGVVMKALGVAGLSIHSQICPGVSWATTLGTSEALAVALKSGNFGGKSFMTDAWSVLYEN